MDSKLIAKYLSKGGFKESSIVLDSGGSRAEKSSAVSGVRHKGSPVKNGNAVESGNGSAEIGSVESATAMQSGITGESKGVSKESSNSTGDMIKFSPTDDFSSLYSKVKSSAVTRLPFRRLESVSFRTRFSA